MAKLDQLIDALFQHQAQRLVLAGGEKAALAFGDQMRPVTSSPLTTDVVTGLLNEIAPADIRGSLGTDGEHTFAYQAPAGPVTVRARKRGDTMLFEAVPTETAPAGSNGSPGMATPSGNGGGAGTAPAGIDPLLQELFQAGCSDLLLCAGNPPLFSKDGSMVTLSRKEPLNAEQV